MQLPSHPLLAVYKLAVDFGTPDRPARALDGVDLSVQPGESLGLVGESGSGKTLTSLAIMGLLDREQVSVAGSIRFDGEELLGKSEKALSARRGRDLSMIFQEPMSALNPIMSIGRQIDEASIRHLRLSGAQARQNTVSLLRRVGLERPEESARRFPHELSGGMRQRVMIAMALACRPKMLIADEPTTALDVTIEKQILDLLKELRVELGMALLLITHDLSVVEEVADKVAIMYAGRVVETGPTAAVFARPAHPYTQALLRSMPQIERVRSRSLSELRGTVPPLKRRPLGCGFADRCDIVIPQCRSARPSERFADGRSVACVRGAA